MSSTPNGRHSGRVGKSYTRTEFARLSPQDQTRARVSMLDSLARQNQAAAAREAQNEAARYDAQMRYEGRALDEHCGCHPDAANPNVAGVLLIIALVCLPMLALLTWAWAVFA